MQQRTKQVFIRELNAEEADIASQADNISIPE